MNECDSSVKCHRPQIGAIEIYIKHCQVFRIGPILGMCYRPKTVALFVYERNYSHFLPDFNNCCVYFHGDGNILPERDQQSDYRTDR